MVLSFSLLELCDKLVVLLRYWLILVLPRCMWLRSGQSLQILLACDYASLGPFLAKEVRILGFGSRRRWVVATIDWARFDTNFNVHVVGTTCVQFLRHLRLFGVLSQIEL